MPEITANKNSAATFDLHLDESEIELLWEIERRQREAGGLIHTGPFTPKQVSFLYSAGLIVHANVGGGFGFVAIIGLSDLGKLVLAFARSELNMSVPSIAPTPQEDDHDRDSRASHGDIAARDRL